MNHIKLYESFINPVYENLSKVDGSSTDIFPLLTVAEKKFNEIKSDIEKTMKMVMGSEKIPNDFKISVKTSWNAKGDYSKGYDLDMTANFGKGEDDNIHIETSGPVTNLAGQKFPKSLDSEFSVVYTGNNSSVKKIIESHFGKDNKDSSPFSDMYNSGIWSIFWSTNINIESDAKRSLSKMLRDVYAEVYKDKIVAYAKGKK